MDTSTLIVVFIVLMIVLTQRNTILIAVRKKRKRRMATMTNELIRKYIGKTCLISTGSFGSSVSGEILDVVENWIEVKTKKGSQLLNADYVTNIMPKES
ncbi:hypothetical protein [Hydrogenoanaerobacterium sp.]|uniref:hypothetical protein n=1 Tax=Hydrogenoanaerobacterium sp. TaxID=2953763 RepID=UPI002896713E|nr:hypothetical protein [Hydrogenoanaerobacterium sp.]